MKHFGRQHTRIYYTKLEATNASVVVGI